MKINKFYLLKFFETGRMFQFKKIIYTLNIKMMSGTALCDQLRPITVEIV